MATIALYAAKVNQMPGMLRDVKSSVSGLKSEIFSLKLKSMGVDKSICDLDDVIETVAAATKVQEDKVAALEAFERNSEQFIEDTREIDHKVSQLVDRRKDNFYKKYEYLKPDCEKSRWEKFCEGCAAAVQWCKENWKAIVKIVAAVVIIVALGIASVLTGGTLALILAGAFWGALIGGVMGGIMGGISSALSGGSFLDGFADGLLSGAITGAITGAATAGLSIAGQAVGKGIECASALGKAIRVTARVTQVLSLGMDGFDLLAMGIGLFNPDSALVKLNQTLNSSVLYNITKLGIGARAVFTGGATTTMKCFVAGTKILTAAGYVAIETVRAGDRVMATNADTFRTEEKPVLETYIRQTAELICLTVNGETIRTTRTHPFYVQDTGFVNAGDLYVGDKLLDAQGNTLSVENITVEQYDKPVKVYNFQVEELHTYHVGHSTILVHNASDAYKAVRKASPSKEIKEAVNKDGKKIDPVYGYEVDRLEADHIMPLKEIVEQPGFDQLSLQDQIEVANTPENFMGLGRSTNASKGSKPLSEWKGHAKLGPIDDATRKQLMKRDEAARKAIADAIKERLKGV